MTRTENKQQKLRANIMYRTKTEHNDQAREKHNEQTRINHKNERNIKNNLQIGKQSQRSNDASITKVNTKNNYKFNKNKNTKNTNKTQGIGTMKAKKE